MQAAHRTILAVDVEGFGDRHRTDLDQLAVRGGLYRALREACAWSGVAWDGCHHEDRGDGVLILIPPDISKSLLASRLPGGLVTALARYNGSCGERARIRLRLALHAGEVYSDDHGVTSGAVNLTFRLLDAEPLRAALMDSRGNLAVIVSAWFFEEVVRHDPGNAPARYRPVRVQVKETDVTAWIGLPDDPYLPATVTAPPVRLTAALRQLPAAPAGFAGRAAELAELTRLLAEPAERDVSVKIAAIVGAAGVGKTALAVHWAHQVSRQFPDGQLYVKLRGYGAGPAVTSGQALDGVLRALGVPAGRLPAEVGEQAAMYRSLLAGRRMLVLLDDARSAEQIRPLLPGSPGCVVLVTSRHRLSGLAAREGAHRISLDPLPPADAVGLLRWIIGPQRLDAAPAAAAELARRCAYLPLALRVAGERAAIRSHLTVPDLVGELSGERSRLDVLAAADDETAAVRAVFSWSYRLLPPAAARMFRLLGRHAGPDISVPAAAALAGTGLDDARRLLDELAEVHLVEESGRDRFRLHDLLRAYAVEQAAPAGEPRAAVARVLTWYLHTADTAKRIVTPGKFLVPPEPLPPPGHLLRLHDQRQAFSWYEAERANLVVATRQAADTGLHVIAWKLPIALWGFLCMRNHSPDWIITSTIGLAAARHQRDQTGEARLMITLGHAYARMRRFDDALEHVEGALQLARRIGDRWAEGASLSTLGIIHYYRTRYQQAITCARQALQVAQEIGEQWLESWILSNLGDANRGLGNLDEALRWYQRSQAIRQQTGDRFGEGVGWHDIGTVYRASKRFADAVEPYQRAVAICSELGNQHGVASALRGLGDCQHQTGQPQAARESWTRALAIFEDLGDPRADGIRARMTTGPISPAKQNCTT